MGERFWEIDFSRGIAVVLMVLFNYAFALRYFRIYQIDGGWLFWWLFPRLIASSFILLAGVSLAISSSRRKDCRKHLLVRGGKIFLLGLAITAVTFALFPEDAILFGILHMIGAGIVVSAVFARFRITSLITGVMLMAAGAVVSGMTTSTPWLLWIGVTPENFRTFDYFPLVPWLGVMLMGIFAGNTLYKKGRRTFAIRNMGTGGVAGKICLIGRHSLAIYMLHQVVLVAALYAIGYAIF